MTKAKERNQLYPIFLKMDKLKVLIVGGGFVACEKLHFILKSSPNANLTVMAPEIRPEILELFSSTDHQISLIHQPFDPSILSNFDIAIAATNIAELNFEVYHTAKEAGLIVNVADTPQLCDFYMGSIVTRGNLKVAISTNGKSPTFAKRFRELLEDILPEEVDDLLHQLKAVRDGLEMDFEEKVEYLNDLTKSMVDQTDSVAKN